MLPSTDGAPARGLRTALQAIIGAFVGLFLAIWAVPGVPEAVTKYISDNLAIVLLTVGVPSGVASYIWNIFRKDVENW